MNSWERLEAVYDAALALPAAERAEFLDARCAGDPALRRELDELLAAAPAAERFFRRFGDAVRATSLELPLAATDSLIGSTFGRYHVEERLGAGGMGVVYRAHDPQLHRVVALKLLGQHLAADAGARKRFLAEARAAASLDHPNICTVYETGEAESGVPYIAMAYCDGETLKARVARGPIEARDAIGIAAQMAQALAAAHARGIVHRDVKPANVMLARDGRVKLVDFGLARLTDVTLTAPGLARGTFAYMAPELLRGQPADASSDIWSLGVVLYEMLTGTRPFRADSDAALLYAIAHQRPQPIEEVLPTIPDELAEIVHRLLHEDPALRYQNAREVAHHLERLAGTSAARPASVTSNVSLPRWAHFGQWKRGLILSAAAAGLVVLSLLSIGDRATSAVPAPPRIAVLSFQDDSPAGEASQLSNAATRNLIDSLAAVPGLNVPSLATVQRYRARGSLPAVADALDADWLVAILVNWNGTRFELTAELSDSTGRLLDSRRIEHADEQRVIEDAVVIVPMMVRERVGAEMTIRRWRSGTRSGEALRLMQQALQEVQNANTLSARSQPETALGALRRADSALVRAASVDPRWSEPRIERAWLARQRAATMFKLPTHHDSVRGTLEEGIRHATAALDGGSDRARAHEVRGVLRQVSTSLLATTATPAELHEWLLGAEGDLRRAVELDPSLARALSALSSIQESRGDFEEARITAEQAYRADYYDQAAGVLLRLFKLTFETGDDEAARERCTAIGRRLPDSWFIAYCRLRLLAWSSVAEADAQAADELVERVVAATPPVIRRSTAAQLEVLAAGAVARASPDSAVRMLDRTLARVAADSVQPMDASDRIVLLEFEAEVRVRVGQRDRAIELLAQYLQHVPEERERLSHSRVFKALFTDPRLAPERPRR